MGLLITSQNMAFFSNFNMQKQSSGGILQKGVLRNFAKFTGKYLCQSLFFNKVSDTVVFCKISENTICCRIPLLGASEYGFMSSSSTADPLTLVCGKSLVVIMYETLLLGGTIIGRHVCNWKINKFNAKLKGLVKTQGINIFLSISLVKKL